MMTNKHICLYNLTGSTICGFTVKLNFYRGKKSSARARVRKMIDEHVRDFWNWWYHNVFAKKKNRPKTNISQTHVARLKILPVYSIAQLGFLVIWFSKVHMESKQGEVTTIFENIRARFKHHAKSPNPLLVRFFGH